MVYISTYKYTEENANCMYKYMHKQQCVKDKHQGMHRDQNANIKYQYISLHIYIQNKMKNDIHYMHTKQNTNAIQGHAKDQCAKRDKYNSLRKHAHAVYRDF